MPLNTRTPDSKLFALEGYFHSNYLQNHHHSYINNKISRLANKFFVCLLFFTTTSNPVYLTLTLVGAPNIQLEINNLYQRRLVTQMHSSLSGSHHMTHIL